MAKNITVPIPEGDVLLLRLAREIAMDQYDLETILAKNEITPAKFRQIGKNPRFIKYLSDEIVNWNSATNTSERVKIKSAAMIEEWLPEAFKQMHNVDAPLLHRNDLVKLVSSLAGMGRSAEVAGGGGERFSVTINLGADQQLKFNKEVTSKVIEGELNDAN
jgi:hypothetical protein